MKSGILNQHKILHDEEKAENLQNIWEIIHGDWDLEQTNIGFYMMKRRFKTCRTCGKLFMETGILNKHKILHDEAKT